MKEADRGGARGGGGILLERREAVFRWMVRYLVPELPDRSRCRLLERVAMPPRIRRERRRWGDWLVKRAAGDVQDRQTLASLLMEALADAAQPLASATDARTAARTLEGMVRETDAPGLVLQVEWALLMRGRGSFARDVVLLLSHEVRTAVEQLLGWIVEDEERIEAERRRAETASLHAVRTAASSVAVARRQVDEAKAEAARQLARATRAGRTAAAKVAEAIGRCTELEARVAALQQMLEERDRLLGDVVRSYEQRLRTRPSEPHAQPLEGLRVLVVGDTPRAEAYRACAHALGARDVRFVEGMDLSESALAAAVPGYDLVAAVVAHLKHSALDIVRRHARSGTRVVMVPRPGLAVFRRVLAGHTPAAG